MLKSEFNILIVEDDQTLGKALREGLSRVGFRTTHVTKPDDALTNARLQPVHFAIIDCMLPKMNGRDLAKKLHDEVLIDTPILLISGVYKDKNFAREALNATGAIGFLTKPFDLQAVIKIVESKMEDKGVDVPLAPLQEILTKENASHKERIRAINTTEEVHAFELPLIYSLLFHPRINGHLNIISADGEVSGVGFQKGAIVQVNQKDAKSYFGVLMVENGFVTQSEIEEVMRTSGKKRKMGESLVEANVLSPHAVQLVMGEQQGLRLSKTIANTSVKVNFIESEDIRVDALVDRGIYTELLNDWLNSKITLDWLKSTYLPWMRYSIKHGPDYLPNHSCFITSSVARAPDFFGKLINSETLEAAIGAVNRPEEEIYRALHTLVVSRVIRFGEASQINDFDSLRRRLIKIDLDLEKQNYFERLNVSSKAKESELKRSYHDLAKILHPDKLSPQTPNDARDLARKAFNKINEAYQTLSDTTLKEKYLIELEKGRAESIMEAEQLTEQARLMLSKGDIRNGRESMERAVSLAPPTSEMRLLHIWARLKTTGSENDLSMLDTIRGEIARIPPEDRHVPTYYYVKGLFLKATGDMEACKRSLEHAVSIAPDFIDARRELSTMQHEKKSNGNDLLRGDLKDVVGMLFKKKK